MKMRHFIVALVLLSGCAGATKKEHQSKVQGTRSEALEESLTTEPAKTTKVRYVGVRGYLNRPPIFLDKESEKSYQRCLPIEVLSVKKVNAQIVVAARQDGKVLNIVGLNRKAFVQKKSDQLPLLDKHFVKDLDWVKAPRELASQASRICSGVTWRDMPVEQFQFLHGDPELRRPLKDKKTTYDVWTYMSQDKSVSRHYYFFAGYLYSWTK